MVKIKDIAIKCNTSTATVSKALHDSSELSPETIEKIKKTAAEMGYIPNAFARALKLKKSFSIGVIFKDTTAGGLKHEYFSSILDALKVECEEKGYNITFLSKSPTNNMSYLQLARHRSVDGVIIVSEEYTNPEIFEIANSSIPVVTIDYIFNSCTAIMSDNSEGIEKIIRHLFDLGHRKIAFIHGEETDVTKKRMAGYYTELDKLGIKANPDYVKDGKFRNAQAAGRATKELVALNDRPTCILYPDDISMFGGITALQESGLRIPEDMSIVGYDGIEISRIYRPMFTTYVQNSTELGRLAAVHLIERIDNPNTFTPKAIYVKGHIQEGSTVCEIN